MVSDCAGWFANWLLCLRCLVCWLFCEFVFCFVGCVFDFVVDYFMLLMIGFVGLFTVSAALF